jgi:galactose oxidase-like protein
MDRREPRLVAVLLIAAIAGVAIGLGAADFTRPTQSPSAHASGSTAPTPSGSASASAAPPDVTVTWTRLSPTGVGPVARQGHTWTVDPGEAVAYLFGGQAGPDAGSTLGDLWAYDLGADAWERVPVAGPAPPPRSRHVAAWLDGVGLVIVGGRGADDRPLDDAWRFDPNAGAWQPLPAQGTALPARSDSCAAVDRAGSLWMSHGLADAAKVLDDTWRYEPGTGRWATVSPASPPAARAGHVCWHDEAGRFLLFGGTAEAPLSDLWVLEGRATVAPTWERLAANVPLGARSDATLALHGGRAVIAGGLDAAGHPVADVGVLTAAGDAIVRVQAGSDEPAGRTRAALIDDPAGERMLLFGGGTAAGVSDEIWQAVLD